MSIAHPQPRTPRPWMPAVCVLGLVLLMTAAIGGWQLVGVILACLLVVGVWIGLMALAGMIAATGVTTLAALVKQPVNGQFTLDDLFRWITLACLLLGLWVQPRQAVVFGAALLLALMGARLLRSWLVGAEEPQDELR